MPTKRRIGKRRNGWTQDHINQLLHGHDYLGRAFGDPGSIHDTFDDEACRECWEDMRDEVLSEWDILHPGSKPWAWWRYDAPEPRQRLDGEPVECDEYHYGRPRFTERREDDSQYESQADYLERLGLN